MTTDDLPARLEVVLTERFTELGNPFAAMRRHEKGPDGWPASHPVGPHQVAEVLRELLTAAPVPPSAPTDRAERVERYAVAIHDAMEPDLSLVDEDPAVQAAVDRAAEAAMAVADAEQAAKPADRAAVLLEAAQHLYTALFPAVYDDMGQKAAEGVNRAVSELRRMAVEAPAPNRAGGETQQGEAEVLAAALDGLHALIATSSRDWQTHRVDAWLWAVLCGWDCEQDEHDETCTHGALEETADMHGWDDATVAKARRYRAAVRAITGPAAAPQPGKEA